MVRTLASVRKTGGGSGGKKKKNQQQDDVDFINIPFGLVCDSVFSDLSIVSFRSSKIKLLKKF